MVITLMYSAFPDACAILKKRVTPRLALSRFLASLMTFVSTKYIGAVRVSHSLKVGVVANVRHGSQHLSEGAFLRFQQRLCQNFAMFGFSAGAMSSCAHLEHLNDLLVNITDYKISHRDNSTILNMLAMIALLSVGVSIEDSALISRSQHRKAYVT